MFSSHVLEHVKDPVFAAQEISRIGKSGVLVCPSFVKESLFMFEEGDHKWVVFPPHEHAENVKDGPILFMRKNGKFVSPIADSNVQAAMARLIRTGPNTAGHEQRILRKWFQEKEKHLDVIVHWEGKLDVKIIE